MSKTAAGEHMQMAVRRQIGPVILTIAQRRLVNEPPAAAAKELTDRFAVFLASAKQNGILGGQIKMLRAADSLTINPGEPLPVSIDDTKESSLVLRLESTDGEGNPVDNVDYITVRLGGTFGSIATLKYKDQTLKPDKAGRYVLKDPGKACELTVTIPPANSDAAQAALYAGEVNAEGTPVPPLDFVLGGKLK